MQSLKNFLIAFGVGLVIFGLFAYAVTGLMGKEKKPSKYDEEETVSENVFATGE